MSRYSKYSDESKVAMIDMLDSKTLSNLVRNCFETEDSDLLELIRHQGRFGVDRDDLRSLDINATAHLSSKCPPMVDALAIYASENFSEVLDYSAIDDPEGGRDQIVAINGFRTSPSVKSFLHSVTRDIMNDLQDTQEPIMQEKDRRDLVVGVLASIGMLTNDTEQVDLILHKSSLPAGETFRSDRILMSALKTPMDCSPQFIAEKNSTNRVLLNAVGLGVYANSSECLQKVYEDKPALISSPVGVMVNGPSNESIYAFEIFHLTQTDPTVEMIKTLVDYCDIGLETNSKAKFAYETWKNEHLIPKSLNGHWPHLIEVCMEKGIYKDRPDLAIKQAAENLYPGVIDHALNYRQGDTWPMVEMYPNLKWFDEKNPVYIALVASDMGGKLVEKGDDAILHMLKAMEQDGKLEEAFSARSDRDMTLGQMSIDAGHVKSLAYMVKNGFNFEQNSSVGVTLMDYARQSTNQTSINAITAAKTYGVAMDILYEIENMAMESDSRPRKRLAA